MQGLSGVAYVRRKINLPRASMGCTRSSMKGTRRLPAAWPSRGLAPAGRAGGISGARHRGAVPQRAPRDDAAAAYPPSQASASRDGTRPVPLSASASCGSAPQSCAMEHHLPPETGLHRPFPARRSLCQHSLQPDASWQHMRLPPPACRPAYQLQGASYWMPCSFPCFSSHIANIISVQTVRNATVVLWRRSNDSRHREHR